MSEKSKLIDKLRSNKKTRVAYIKANISVNIASQIRALRRRRKDMTQKELAQEAGMMQPRISAMERPGETNYNVETLIRLAAALKVGLIVKFAPFSEMLRWENEFSQDTFDVATIDEDIEFQREGQPAAAALPKSVLQPEVQNIAAIEPRIVATSGSGAGVSTVAGIGIQAGGELMNDRRREESRKIPEIDRPSRLAVFFTGENTQWNSPQLH